jgi:hypothetical protein
MIIAIIEDLWEYFISLSAWCSGGLHSIGALISLRCFMCKYRV